MPVDGAATHVYDWVDDLGAFGMLERSDESFATLAIVDPVYDRRNVAALTRDQAHQLTVKLLIMLAR